MSAVPDHVLIVLGFACLFNLYFFAKECWEERRLTPEQRAERAARSEEIWRAW
jgi:hypothetical protein